MISRHQHLHSVEGKLSLISWLFCQNVAKFSLVCQLSRVCAVWLTILGCQLQEIVSGVQRNLTWTRALHSVAEAARAGLWSDNLRGQFLPGPSCEHLSWTLASVRFALKLSLLDLKSTYQPPSPCAFLSILAHRGS